MDEILVAVDGCDHSRKIVDVAADIAQQMSARLVLLYVAPKLEVPDEYVVSLTEEEPKAEDYSEEFSHRVLGDLRERAEDRGVEVEEISGIGSPAGVILEAAKKRGASMIVIGVHGMNYLKGLRSVGSVTTRVIQNSPVPVVSVP